VMVYQSMSGDASGANGYFTMTGGTLAYTSSSGPLFYITNTTGNINLTGVTLSAASGVLLKAASGSWGTAGSNGGIANLTTSGQTLTGNMEVDGYSTLALSLTNGSTLSGTINGAATAKSVSVNLDAKSSWKVTGNSRITTLSDAGGISGSSVSNIVGNGFNVYYKSASNTALNGLTYSLSNGGQLIPY